MARSSVARWAAQASRSRRSRETAGAISEGTQFSKRNSGTARVSVTRFTSVAVSTRTIRLTRKLVSALAS